VKLLSDVCATLTRSGVRHALVGATALAAHGVARATMDVDLLTVEDRVLNPEMWDPLRQGTTRVDIRHGDTDDPFRAVVRIERPEELPVDVLVGRFSWQRDMIDGAKPIEIGGANVPVVAAPDLILLKLFAGGSQDLSDVRRLLEVVSRDPIVREVDARVAVLPPDCQEHWERLRRGDSR
jgi:predicted nucleotidyltransferase